MLDKLKQRWELKSNLDVLLVMIMFSCAGMSSVWIKKPLFAYLNFSTGETTLDLVKYILLYVMFFMPIYQAMLLFWGFVFGGILRRISGCFCCVFFKDLELHSRT